SLEGPAWARGLPTVLAPNRKTCPHLSFSVPAKWDRAGGDSCWGSGFLPTVNQGVQFRSSGDPVLYLSDPRGTNAARPRDTLDSIRRLNQIPRSRHASIPTRWPSGCNPTLRNS